MSIDGAMKRAAGRIEGRLFGAYISLLPSRYASAGGRVSLQVGMRVASHRGHEAGWEVGVVDVRGYAAGADGGVRVGGLWR
jgi:hypothetical protein